MKVLRNALIAISACLCAAPVVAQEGLVDEIRQPTLKALEGKKVVFVPMSMSFDLPEGWAAVMQKEADRLGYHLDIRDANWSTDTGTRAITQAILTRVSPSCASRPICRRYWYYPIGSSSHAKARSSRRWIGVTLMRKL
jgi:ABC-type sugar transport system substrate-binding protein